MPFTPHRTSKTETIFSLSLLALLGIIVLAVLSAQVQFNPAVINFTPDSIQGEVSVANKQADHLPLPLPADIETMSPMEKFGAETLSDKINGKAELYLSAGFVRLQTQRYRSSTHPEQWFEVFIYDMGAPTNAFAVYSSQRRQDVEKLHFTKDAYRTTNALFFSVGQYYVEMIAAAQSERASSMLVVLAEKYINYLKQKDQTATDAPVPKSDPKEVFPSEGLDVNSITLISKDAFGFSGLDQVYTAQYLGPNIKINLFVSLRPSPEEAKTLMEAYRDFLLQFGGTEVTVPESSPVEGLIAIGVMDAYEVMFSRGPYLAGVHMADDLDTAGQLAAKVDQKLADMGVAP